MLLYGAHAALNANIYVIRHFPKLSQKNRFHSGWVEVETGNSSTTSSGFYMNDYQTIKIEPSFCVKVLPESRGFELSDVEKEEIASIWNDQLRDRGHHLVNGQLLNVVSAEGQQWVGEFVDYKFYLAQLAIRISGRIPYKFALWALAA